MQTTPSWMQHAGLLAGLGPRAFVPRVEGDALASDLSFRTCIEAGSGALVSVQAPGARRLNLWTRRPSAPGAQRWTHWLDGQEVGQVTSSVVSPRLGPIALAYVRRGSEAPGTSVEVEAEGARRSAEVRALPFAAS